MPPIAERAASMYAAGVYHSELSPASKCCFRLRLVATTLAAGELLLSKSSCISSALTVVSARCPLAHQSASLLACELVAQVVALVAAPRDPAR